MFVSLAMDDPSHEVHLQKGHEALLHAIGVIGIGSPFDRMDLQTVLRDEAADSWGWAVVDAMIDWPSHVTVRNVRHPLDLMDWIEDFHSLHIVDSIYWSDLSSSDMLEAAKRPASTISQSRWNDDYFRLWKWDAEEVELQMQFRSDSHSLGLVEVLSIAKTMGWIPARVTLWGVEALHRRNLSREEALVDNREGVQSSLRRMGERIKSVIERDG